jgi:tetratricopeptide (TPR) repeat protein
MRWIVAALSLVVAANAVAEERDTYLVKCLTAGNNGPEEQIKACTAAIDSGRPDETWFVYGMRASAYVSAKRWDEAISDLSKAIELKPDDAIAYESRGWAYEEKGELAKAIENYREAARLNPNFELPRENLARLRIK